MHPLLDRQLKRLGLNATSCPADPQAWQALLVRISRSYQEGEQGRSLLERSLDVTSREMQGLYESLQRSSETELAQARNKLEAVLHSLGDGLCVVDAEWRIQLVNTEAERLFCAQSEQLRGRPIYHMLSPGPEEHQSECLITDASFPPLQRGEPYRTNDGVLVQGNGQLLPVSLVVTPVVTDQGVVGAVLVFRDISAEKSAQERQALTEALLRRIQSGLRKLATDPVIFHGHLETALYSITEIAAHTLNIERISIWFFSPDRATIHCAARHAQPPSRRSQQFELSRAACPRYFAELEAERVIDADECQTDPRTSELREIYFKPLGISSLLAVPVRAEASLIGMVCHEHIGPRRHWTMEEQQFAALVANTVSLALEAADRHKAEQALRTVSTFQKAILDHAGHAIISTTPEGVIQTFNPAAERLLGYPASEMIGTQTPLLFHDPEEIAARAQQFSEELGVPLEPGFEVFVVNTRHNRSNEHEWTYVRKDGTRLTVLLSITALQAADGRIVGFLGMANDITERKIVERQLVAAKEAAEAANVAKSQFLANMSHEIRTPMNGVLGMTELLLAGGLTDHHLRLTQTIYRSATSLLGIVNDILDFSKIEAGKLVLEHLEFNLPQLIEEVVDTFAEAAQRKNLELICKVPLSVPPVVAGDPVRLRQVLSNLLGNAVKFTEAGEVMLEVETIGREDDQVVCRFTVSDTGMGIPTGVQETIFEPFAQADGSTTRRYGGTGLGLAIVRQLLSLMDGKMGVSSAPGNGSKFWFSVRLPIHGRQGGVDSNLLFVHPTRILIADDNASQRRWLDQFLTAQGARCTTAHSGGQAVARFSDAAASGEPFHMALIDLHMPDGDGIQTIEALAALPDLPSPKLFLIAPFGLHTVPETALPVTAILTKPILTSTLMRTLRQAPADLPGSSSASGDRPALFPRLAGPFSLRVLLAEDNHVNREVAIGMLSALGCSVEAVESGEAAVEHAAAQPYDIILMDCQMPVMDGYAATRLIRNREQSSHTHIPIIALTANALPGDRERCLEAGMDDYLSKPFSLKDLATVLGRFLHRTRPARCSSAQQNPESVALARDHPQDPSVAPEPGQPLINPQAWTMVSQLQRAGQPDLLAKLLRLYLKDSQDLVDKIEAAVRQRNMSLLRESAHSLKSRSATLGAQRLAVLCQQVEQAGHAGSCEQADRLAPQLHRTFTDTCALFHQELRKRAA